MKYRVLILIMFIFGLNQTKAQDYTKDSLQFKIITAIKYHKSKVEDIKLKKVLCDYCTEEQKKQLGLQAIKLSELEQNDPKNRKENGIKILSIYIRLSKEDFKALNK
ncbi:hypothetical protein [Mesoflavibacter zeaxanthinifaciens]|uniref:hypothetical protein n=1 Tax=Mesoflavibacter zeaxanthinifaciens TaxID=393060 RepID=UPI003A94DCC2